MGVYARDKSRYGIFKAHSNVGMVTVEISILGFGEEIIVTQDKKIEYQINTLSEEEHYYEDEEKLIVGDIEIQKPFIKTIKRFR